MGQTRLRVMSYNVHRCIGRDGVLSVERIAGVIRHYRPQVVALQELDIGHARTQHADQPKLISRLVKMHYCFYPAVDAVHEHYGDAILSKTPIEVVRAGPLPTLPGRAGLERRAALWARIRYDEQTVQVINTHLGLDHRERIRQVTALAGPEWLGHPQCGRPRIFCGDLNAWPGTRAYARIRSILHDAQEKSGLPWWRNTFPSQCPVVCIDHVFHSPDLKVTDVMVPRTPLSRIASDHLPIIVELEMP